MKDIHNPAGRPSWKVIQVAHVHPNWPRSLYREDTRLISEDNCTYGEGRRRIAPDSASRRNPWRFWMPNELVLAGARQPNGCATRSQIFRQFLDRPLTGGEGEGQDIALTSGIFRSGGTIAFLRLDNDRSENDKIAESLILSSASKLRLRNR